MYTYSYTHLFIAKVSNIFRSAENSIANIHIFTTQLQQLTHDQPCFILAPVFSSPLNNYKVPRHRFLLSLVCVCVYLYIRNNLVAV